jgi:predicted porin
MQKKIIALAVAAAFSAPAFADVAFYGIVDAAVANVSADGQKSDLLAVSGGLSGSRIGAKVTEGLDNGMTAVAVLEYALDTEVSTGLTGATARQQMLAVAGDFGTIATGYLQTTAYDFNAKFDPTYGSAVSPIQSVNKGGGFLLDGAARAQRAVAYISPKIGGTMTFAVNYATALAGLGNLTKASAATTGLKTTAFLVSGTFDQGPLTAGAVYTKLNNDNTGGASPSEFAFGVAYDLGMAKVMGTYASHSTGAATSVTNTMFSLSGVMPMGGGALAATYSSNSMNTANTNGKGFMVGYLHNLSKSTTAYVAFENMKNGSATSAYSVFNNGVAAGFTANGGNSNLIAAGLRKKF